MKLDIGIDIKFEDNLKQNIDAIKKNIEEDLKQAIKTLGSSGLKKAQDLAEEKLHGKLSNVYKSNLKIEQVSDNTVIIELKEEAFWIEKGRKPGFMEDLLNAKSGSPAKTSKDGHKYRVIPMKSTGGSQPSPSTGEDLVGQLKNFLKTQGIRTSQTKGLELDASGSPRTGKMHTFDIKNMRDKGFPKDLKNISVFQNKNPNTGKVERSVVAFRVISDKNKESGKWNHPGTPPARILEETFKYIEQQWQTQIFPAIKAKYENK
jgi:hypothetical protein